MIAACAGSGKLWALIIDTPEAALVNLMYCSNEVPIMRSLLRPVLLTATTMTSLAAFCAESVTEENFDGWMPERRHSQFSTEPGYVASPALASIPGIGIAYGAAGALFNIAGSSASALGFAISGDIQGYGLGIMDIPMLWAPLSLTLYNTTLDKGIIEQNKRGIHSDPAQSVTVSFDKFIVNLAQFNLRFFEKRLQLSAGYNTQRLRPDAIYDRDGNKIADSEKTIFRDQNVSLGLILDFTDDRTDPRKGWRFEVQRYDPPRTSESVAQYYIMDYNLSSYIPVGQRSVWAFNLYRSDAVVTAPGVTDPDVLRDDLDYQCDAIAGADQRESCRKEQNDEIAARIEENRHGTASTLGGTQRLRSFVSNRFYAAHALFWGTELRWNVTEEFSPFDYGVAKGVRTGVQTALFFEQGTVAETVKALNYQVKSSYGIGLRLIIASGFVVRLDMAGGDEGWQPTLIFDYPWCIF